MLLIGVTLIGILTACAHQVATLDAMWSGQNPGEIYVTTTVRMGEGYQPTLNDPHFGRPAPLVASYLLRCQDEAFSPTPRPVLTCTPIATVGDILQAALMQKAVEIQRPSPTNAPSEQGPVDPITGLR